MRVGLQFERPSLRRWSEPNSVEVMHPRVRSFDVHASRPKPVLAALETAARATAGPLSAAVVFVCGSLAGRLTELAAAVTHAQLPFAVALAAGTGVMTERGEAESDSAAAGLVWAGPPGRLCGLGGAGEHRNLGQELVEEMPTRGGNAATLLLLQPDGFSPLELQGLQHLPLGRSVFGGGTVGRRGALGVLPGGKLVAERGLALDLSALGVARVRVAHSCRVLGPMHAITEAQGSLVLKLDGKPALDVLTECVRGLKDQPLILTVLAPSRETLEDDSTETMLVRGVQGIDAHRRALSCAAEMGLGLKMSFAVRDAATAQRSLQHVARQLDRSGAGSAPTAALYVYCAGRGLGLYGRRNVDTRIITDRFGALPMAGFQSTFEIAPHAHAAALQLYTGVLGLFGAPS